MLAFLLCGNQRLLRRASFMSGFVWFTHSFTEERRWKRDKNGGSVSIFNSLLNVVIPWKVEVGFKSVFFLLASAG